MQSRLVPGALGEIHDALADHVAIHGASEYGDDGGGVLPRVGDGPILGDGVHNYGERNENCEQNRWYAGQRDKCESSSH
jgi:hypothetical protein